MPEHDGRAGGVRRVLILGGPGCGKTTLARSLASLVGLPHRELDRMAYARPDSRPGAPLGQWARVPDEVRRERAAALAGTERWVVDGVYAGWTSALRDAADIVVWLDLPSRVTTLRVFKRAVKDRWRGGRDWDVHSTVRVARGARSYRTRPAATSEELRKGDGANAGQTLEVFLLPAADRVVRCRTTRQVGSVRNRLAGVPET